MIQPVGRKAADPDAVTPQALRSMCESVLQLVTNTIDIMEKVCYITVIIHHMKALCQQSSVSSYIWHLFRIGSCPLSESQNSFVM